ncbi:MAG: family 10 glycosylhydrolase [Lentisphaerae bacterium]|nr:family 10 glycosylhydrolase [Lentisphaerota bacterium]MBT4817162.1 family 10 glycosylhydrolase [Lentisphaerota bacterium]MBT5612196.1 family 10 glycosylhydrolase [Lentisphaerota bacterium]MBT7061123.1 family 10 glycosylhydrolase [Lentisphaerota bacterium]MBT7843452.1 family 10 glycosylhydrolase [Lentisphaerota bacterium]
MRRPGVLSAAAVATMGLTGCIGTPLPHRPAAAPYRCIFNHELLIVSHRKDNSREYVESFIKKLEDTDVDAVMCCPQLWRTNTFRSDVDPTWKSYKPGQPLSKFRSYDYMMTYLHAGGDPVQETIDACRKYGKDVFISYRMNDHHYIQDLEWPCHNDFWRDHPEYWLADSDTSPYSRGKDDVRLHNYMLPEVRDYYFAIIRELCTNYDVDGVEFDFQRFPRFFRNDEIAEGTKVMTAFVRRVRAMVDRIGSERGKTMRLCARVPHTIAKCEKAGLDVIGWDAARLLDMINVSSFYVHTMEMAIEDFAARTRHARVYGEMNYVLYQNSKVDRYARRYTTFEVYRASALNLFSRGADGLSLFNYDYVPSKVRAVMAPGLKRITDLDFLRTSPKNYVVYPGFGTFPATNRRTVEVIIPDDTEKVPFDRAVLRVETQKSCADLTIGVRLNGKLLLECEHAGVELFGAVAENAGYATRECLRFYTVPLDLLVAGKNTVEVENIDQAEQSCRLFSLEIGLFQ